MKRYGGSYTRYPLTNSITPVLITFSAYIAIAVPVHHNLTASRHWSVGFARYPWTFLKSLQIFLESSMIPCLLLFTRTSMFSHANHNSLGVCTITCFIRVFVADDADV